MARRFTAKDYMSKTLVIFRPDMDIQEATHLVLEKNVPGGPVIDNMGNRLGVLSEKDCLEAVLKSSYYEESGGRVREYMQSDVEIVDADTSIVEVAEAFLRFPFRHFPVIKDNRMVGHITRRDVLRALGLLREQES